MTDNQWQVDFNLNLDSFEPHIAGTRDLINLSNQSPNRPLILFTSSISTVDNWTAKNPGTKVPESAFYDFSIPAAMGYGESKYIAEQLLEKAATTSGVSAVICRVGQLAGPVVKAGGLWNKQEWLPSVSPSPTLWSHLLSTHLRAQTDHMTVSAAHSQFRPPRQDPYQPSRPRYSPLDPRRRNRNHHPRPPLLLPLSLPNPYTLDKILQRHKPLTQRLLVLAHPRHNRPQKHQHNHTRPLLRLVLGPQSQRITDRRRSYKPSDQAPRVLRADGCCG